MTHQNLEQWENSLQAQIVDGNLLLGQLPLGQPPYDDKDRIELGQHFAKVFAGRSFRSRLDYIERTYPVSFALYLVLEGIYGYRGGEYWPPIGGRLNIASEYNYTSYCGQLFRRVLKRFRLPTFEHIEGQANLVPILAHGGIPNYSLGDFFKLLSRSVRQSPFGADAESLIEEWASHPEEAFFWIDRPVQRFVLHGGYVAEDFVSRCILLLTAASDEEMEELELPHRIVEAFKLWKHREDISSVIPTTRLEKPFVYLDPYGGDGVTCGIPPQRLPSSSSIDSVSWIISADGKQMQELFCDRDRVSGGYEFSLAETVVLPIAKQYAVTLLANGQPWHTWQLAGFADWPLLIFDADSGELLRSYRRQEPGTRWLLHPADSKLTIEDAVKLEEMPQQFGEWGKYAISAWELSPGSRLLLQLRDESPFEIKFASEGVLRRPFLEGGRQPLQQQLGSKLPLYSGLPPALVFPFAEPPGDTKLRQWRVTIVPAPDASPAERRSYRLNDLRHVSRIRDEGSLVLNLAARELLGYQPCGQFEVVVRGPFGHGRRIGLRIVPELDVVGHTTLYCSAADGPATFEIACGLDSMVECLTQTGVAFEGRLHNGRTQYHVIASPDVDTVRFRLTWKRGTQVPFSVRSRRVRWGLWQETAPKDFAWTSSVSRRCIDALNDPYTTLLYVDLPTLAGEKSLVGGWRLIDTANRVLMERPPDASRSRQQFTINVGDLMTEIRKARDSGTLLSLQIWLELPTQEGKRDRLVDALIFTPTIELGDIIAEGKMQDETAVRLSLAWDADRPFQNLSALLWPLDQPWVEEPLCLDLNGQSPGFAEVDIDIDQLPGTETYQGDYLGVLDLVDPWAAQTPTRPEPGSGNTFVLAMADSAAYYERLANGMVLESEVVADLMTAVAYHSRQAQLDPMFEAARRLSEKRKQHLLSLEELVLWANVAKYTQNPQLYKLAQMDLFSERVLEKLEGMSHDHPLVTAYLAHFPDNYLDTMIYIHLVVLGVGAVRKKCIQELCNARDEIGIQELLSDVSSGAILVTEAAQMLSRVSEFAVGELLKYPSADAIDILTEMARLKQIQPTWIRPGFDIATRHGVFRVLRLFVGSDLEPKVYSLLDEEPVLDVRLDGTDTPVLARLEVGTGNLQFPAAEVYPCFECQRIHTERKALLEHYDDEHPYAPKRLQPRRSLKTAIIEISVT